MEGHDGRRYGCVNGDVAVRVGDRRQVIGKVPADVASSQWVGSYEENKTIVIGSSGCGKAPKGKVLDWKSKKWRKIEVPLNSSGYDNGGGGINW